MPLPRGVTLDRRVARTVTEDVTREVSTPGRVIDLTDYSEDWTLFFLNQFSTYQEIGAQSAIVSSWIDDVARLLVDRVITYQEPAEVSIGDVLVIAVTGWGTLSLNGKQRPKCGRGLYLQHV